MPNTDSAVGSKRTLAIGVTIGGVAILAWFASGTRGEPRTQPASRPTQTPQSKPLGDRVTLHVLVDAPDDAPLPPAMMVGIAKFAPGSYDVFRSGGWEFLELKSRGGRPVYVGQRPWPMVMVTSNGAPEWRGPWPKKHTYQFVPIFYREPVAAAVLEGPLVVGVLRVRPVAKVALKATPAGGLRITSNGWPRAEWFKIKIQRLIQDKLQSIPLLATVARKGPELNVPPKLVVELLACQAQCFGWKPEREHFMGGSRVRSTCTFRVEVEAFDRQWRTICTGTSPPLTYTLTGPSAQRVHKAFLAYKPVIQQE